MAAAIQRPLRGSRISTFYPVKNLPSLSSLDSAFQLQEYISLLIRFDVHDVDAIVSLPGSSKDKEEHSEVSKDSEKPEVTVDEACWIYEQLRRLAQDLSHPLITTLQQECTRASCPEMKAGEWLYLCVAHGNDGAMEQCCAIDYILHTVDSATALLNSPRTFPSRLQIPQTSHRHFASLARRLGRIFAHAYFHHREAFEQAEAESSLYARFLALTAKFDLVPSEFLVIPSSGFHGDDGSDDDVPRGYAEGRQHYPPQLREEDHQRFEREHHQQEQQLRHEEAAQAAAASAEAGGGSNSGGVGESPTSAGKARLTRPRTYTMIPTDAPASAPTEELAARTAEHEDEHEHEAPATARPTITAEQGVDEDEAQFEIVLSPEEKPVVQAEEASSVQLEEAPAVVEEPATPAEAETPAAEAEKGEQAVATPEVEALQSKEPASQVEESPEQERSPVVETEAEPAPTAEPSPPAAEVPSTSEPAPEVSITPSAEAEPAAEGKSEPEPVVEAVEVSPPSSTTEEPASEPVPAPAADAPAAPTPEPAVEEKPLVEEKPAEVEEETTPAADADAAPTAAAEEKEAESVVAPIEVADADATPAVEAVDVSVSASEEAAPPAEVPVPEVAPAAVDVTTEEPAPAPAAPVVVEESGKAESAPES